MAAALYTVKNDDKWTDRHGPLPLLGGNPKGTQHFCIIQSLRCKGSRSEWFDVKWCIAEKPNNLDVFTVVLIGTRGCNVYSTTIAISFTIQNDQ